MEAKNNGGPAFPVVTKSEEYNGATYTEFESGMTLRDYFAAKIAAGDAAWGDGWSNEVTDYMINKRAALYYRIADAMLKEREA
jgi:hypothetical protein